MSLQWGPLHAKHEYCMPSKDRTILNGEGSVQVNSASGKKNVLAECGRGEARTDRSTDVKRFPFKKENPSTHASCYNFFSLHVMSNSFDVNSCGFIIFMDSIRHVILFSCFSLLLCFQNNHVIQKEILYLYFTMMRKTS